MPQNNIFCTIFVHLSSLVLQAAFSTITLSMGEFGLTDAEGAMPMNAQANGPSIYTLWRAAFSCTPKGLRNYKPFVIFNLSGNRTGGHQFL